ncbi:lysophospholipase [Chitinimonas arctica]|uniref:Lysophospholipase n=1 Tax=Chitinimonas arctica TaxID=2594795 RepID=A0A516SIE6_9NEIS|nr:alpha/beta fold hydrolase [Chitinimonas arctica]QDQ27923.1 lysophospholipase [Chitinimonas arctica]
MKLVLLPGMDGTGTLYEGFREAIAPFFALDVIRYPLDEMLGYAELAQWVQNQLPSNEPFILLGESFSGPIAIGLAAQRLPGLCGVVLCCTFAKLPTAIPSPLRWVSRAISPALAPRWAVNVLMLGRYASPRQATQLHRALSLVKPAVLRHRVQAVMSVDACETANHIAVPVLYLQATGDRVIARAAERLLRATLPSMSTARIAAPHLLLQSNPGDAATAIGAWAATHSIQSNG